MHPTLDEPITLGPDAYQERGAARPRRYDLPDLYDPPKKRLPPVVLSGIGFLFALFVFYGAQAVAPPALKPSTLVSAYDTQLQEARKAGELEAQIRYEAQLRVVELQHQAQLKEIETAALQWQEQYKTVLTGYLEGYRATWQRANIWAQATADIQKTYANYRYSVTQGTLGGHMQVANLATIVGLFGGIVDPAFEASALQYANRVRSQALDTLDQSARGGVTVSVEGWDTGLKDPAILAAEVNALPPLHLPGFRPMPIAVPQVSDTPVRADVPSAASIR